MAKRKVSVQGNLNIAPWQMEKEWAEKYVLITEDNRKMAVIMGRKIYVIRNGLYCGFLDIRPQLVAKSKLRIEKGLNKQDLFIFKGETLEEYKSSFKEVLDNGIREKILYINPKDKLIKYYKL